MGWPSSLTALSLCVGNYLILAGYEAVQESSTDEEGAVWLPPHSAAVLPTTDPAQQQRPSSQKALSDGAVSPFTPQRWGALEGACVEIQSPFACADSPGQVLECIRKIEAALEHLKVRGPGPSGLGGRQHVDQQGMQSD